VAYLRHYGTPRHSGRYPWGSGKDPQRSPSFSTQVAELKKKGKTEPEIAQLLGLKNSTELRARIHIESESKYGAQAAMAARLRAKGYSDVAISKRMNISPNTVKNILLPETQERHRINEATKNMLQSQADAKGMIDVGNASNLQLGVARTKMDVSIAELVMSKGYVVTEIQTPQLGTPNKTTVRVLMSPESMKKAREQYTIKDPEKWKDLPQDVKDAKIAYLYASKNSGDIRMITDWSSDGGETYKSLQPPVSISSKRIKVRFDDDEPSGSAMDGVIQLRRGVEDLSLPAGAHYGQVRIAVDGTHYMKGMAIYSDDMPDGVDIIYNSTKKSSAGKLGAMKPMNTVLDTEDGASIYLDADGKQKINEFGASIRQMTYTDKKGKEQQSAINIVGFAGNQDSGIEGSWNTWSKTLSSQFLSKQSPALAKQQLNLAYLDSKDTFDQYMRITQPAVKQRLLDSFADECDSNAVHLKAAALPRQTSNVIIPIVSLKDNECYSANYRDGEQLALIRYPHAGVFEIPIVTNNTKNKEGKSVLGTKAIDAIGITPRTAEQLSGADFDGDTVIAIPYDSRLIKSSSALKALEGFNPKTAYPAYDGMPKMSGATKQQEMGRVSNLITDMTVKGAPLDEIARAVKHSMVVIDAEKHNLNYKLSYNDNGIAELKSKYQGGTISKPRGASTLISRASSEERVDKRKALTKDQAEASGRTLVRKGAYSVDVNTGEKVFMPTGEGYYKNGKFVPKQIKSTKMYEATDARKLMSKNAEDIEIIYANYANSMKSLGDLARKESAAIKMTPQSKTAKEVYKNEIATLNAKLQIALANAPLERQVHLVGNKQIEMRKAANPDMEPKQIKKLKGQVLNEMRERIGANKQRVQITPKEWEAIESGAISNSLLSKILNNTNLDVVQTYATPRAKTMMSESKIARAKIYQQQGRTLAQISDMLGVSVSTLSNALKGE